jgi:hypothetical protein
MNERLLDIGYSVIGWFGNAKRRAICFIRTHDLHTEYRAYCDTYGETWCQRCGEYEPDHWLPDNGDFRADILLLIRDAPWDEKHYVLGSLWRRLAYYARRLVKS